MDVITENWISWYRKQDPSIWTGRNDHYTSKTGSKRYPQRMYEVVTCIDLEDPVTKKKELASIFSSVKKPDAAIIGFCSDLGVQRNQGRVGAATAPPVIRSKMANLAVHNPALSILDAGDIVLGKKQKEALPVRKDRDPLNQIQPGFKMEHTSVHQENHKSSLLNDPLIQAQQLLSDKLLIFLQQEIFTLILGGGHEVAKPHYDALKKVYPGEKIGIINLDAHFDLRQDPLAPTSGTSFFEIWQSDTDRFHYFVIGVQPFANTSALYDTARKTGTKFIEAGDIPITGLTLQQKDEVLKFTDSVDKIMLTICMDVFQSAVSPGVSAPSPFGLHPHQIHEILSFIRKSGKVISVDIAETNPIVDPYEMSSGLASLLANHLIHF